MITEALGIEIGDLVSTSYSRLTGRVTRLWAPHFTDAFVGVLVIRTWLVTDLAYRSAGDNADSYIGSIRREGDRRFTDQNDEVFIVKADRRWVSPAQMDLFGPPAPDPYPFRAGVDYSQNAWHCDVHGDFNAIPVERGRRAHCPLCKSWYPVPTQLILMEPRQDHEPQWSDYQVAQGFTGRPQAQCEASATETEIPTL